MRDITALLEKMRAEPYEDVIVRAPHTGNVCFIGPPIGSRVSGTSGKWKEIPGTPLLELTRENNTKIITAPYKGHLSRIRFAEADTFVEAGEELAIIRHYLTREEVVERILRHALSLFLAPERAKYLFTPLVDAKINASGYRSVTVRHGMELLIMTRMKREMPVYYTGPDGIIYAVYFSHNDTVDAGSPLIGVCPQDEASMIEEMILRVQTEWVEQD